MQLKFGLSDHTKLTTVNGKAWFIELVLWAECEAMASNWFTKLIVFSLLIGFVPLAVLLTCEYFKVVQIEDKSIQFWIYYLLMCLNFGFTMFQSMLNFANNALDADKRNLLMVKLSESLELDFNKKNPENIRFPTLNFMDT